MFYDDEDLFVFCVVDVEQCYDFWVFEIEQFVVDGNLSFGFRLFLQGFGEIGFVEWFGMIVDQCDVVVLVF